MKIVHTNQIPEVGVSHNEAIKKKVFLEEGYIPQLISFGSATFKPGQSADTHIHVTMFEVFYVLSGKVEFVVNDKKMELTEGDCITIEPRENHSQSNPYNENVTLLYFKVAAN